MIDWLIDQHSLHHFPLCILLTKLHLFYPNLAQHFCVWNVIFSAGFTTLAYMLWSCVWPSYLSVCLAQVVIQSFCSGSTLGPIVLFIIGLSTVLVLQLSFLLEFLTSCWSCWPSALLPRDAPTTTTYNACCLSDGYKPVLYQDGLTDRADFRHEATFGLCVLTEVGYLQKLG